MCRDRHASPSGEGDCGLALSGIGQRARETKKPHLLPYMPVS
jgi:hypothetical protein